jgi:ABC-type branched-subunit amino acid transport system substrate-binding protein
MPERFEMHTLTQMLRRLMSLAPLMSPARFPRRGDAGRRLPIHWRRPLLLGAAAVMLAACQPVPMSGSGPAVSRDEPVRVALLVPRSSDGTLAQSLENAARLAVSDLQGAQIDLRVYDTGGNPQRAAQVAQQAVSEGARVILGPVFAEEANATGVAVASRGINVLSFSNNPAIAGGNVFVLGQTFQNTANRLVRFANGRGRGNIFIVHGRDTAETLGRDAIQGAVNSSGARLAGTASFDLSQQGVINAIPSIANQIQLSNANAVFFTSTTAGALPLLLERLPRTVAAPGPYQYIGLTRLDIPQAALALPGAQGAWFAMPDPRLTAQFDARYRAAHGRAPLPIAALAYDGIAMIGASVASGRADALGRAALTRGSGFSGVTGVIRLMPDGTNERGLAVAQVRDGRIVIVESAPRGFTGPGF